MEYEITPIDLNSLNFNNIGNSNIHYPSNPSVSLNTIQTTDIESHYSPDRKPILNDYDSFIVVCFNQGYAFKTLVDYLKESNDVVNLKFSKAGITCTEQSKNRNILNDIKIKGHKLLEYYFQSKYEELIYGFNLKNLLNAIEKIATKTDPPLVMVKLPMSESQDGEAFNFYSEKVGRGGISSMNFIRPINGTSIQEFIIDKYSDERNASIKLQVATLVLCFSTLSKNKTNFKIRGYPSLLTLSMDSVTNGYITDIKSEYNYRIYSYTENDYIIDDYDEELINMDLETKVLKALEKIGTIGDKNQILYIYVEKDKPLKLKCDIGSFGKLRIYIKGKSI